MECAAVNPKLSVIYFAKMEHVEHLRMSGNVLKKQEEEIAFGIAPIDFYSLTDGYVHYKDLQKLLSEMGFDVYQLVRMDNLTDLCAKTKEINAKELEKLMVNVEKFIKSP